jgi:hypothetical protein
MRIKQIAGFFCSVHGSIFFQHNPATDSQQAFMKSIKKKNPHVCQALCLFFFFLNCDTRRVSLIKKKITTPSREGL